MRHTRLIALAGLLMLGAGTGCDGLKKVAQKADLVDPDTPDTPDETVLRKQIAVLAEVDQHLDLLQDKELQPEQVIKRLQESKARLHALQNEYTADADVLNFRPSLRSAHSKHIKEFVAIKTRLPFSYGMSRSSALSEELSSILELVGPKRRPADTTSSSGK